MQNQIKRNLITFDTKLINCSYQLEEITTSNVKVRGLMFSFNLCLHKARLFCCTEEMFLRIKFQCYHRYQQEKLPKASVLTLIEVFRTCSFTKTLLRIPTAAKIRLRSTIWKGLYSTHENKTLVRVFRRGFGLCSTVRNMLFFMARKCHFIIFISLLEAF